MTGVDYAHILDGMLFQDIDNDNGCIEGPIRGNPDRV